VEEAEVVMARVNTDQEASTVEEAEEEGEKTVVKKVLKESTEAEATGVAEEEVALMVRSMKALATEGEAEEEEEVLLLKALRVTKAKLLLKERKREITEAKMRSIMAIPEERKFMVTVLTEDLVLAEAENSIKTVMVEATGASLRMNSTQLLRKVLLQPTRRKRLKRE